MKKTLKKAVLASLIALQLGCTTCGNIKEAHAKEKCLQEGILLDENGKILQLISIIIDDYEYITFGYVFRRSNCIYIKDALSGRIYNMSNIDELYNTYIVFTDALNVLPEELKEKNSIKKDFANELAKDFYITLKTIQVYGGDNELHDFTHETFGKEDFDNSNLPISIIGGFDKTSPYGTVTSEFNEMKEDIYTDCNNYKLGIYENNNIYNCYENIYQKVATKLSCESGVIIRYYVFDTNGNYIQSLYTQKQIDEFLEKNKDKLDSFVWKSAIYTGKDVDDILTKIDNNEVVSSTNGTYFIDYKGKKLEYK